jgi:hypothetical protein
VGIYNFQPRFVPFILSGAKTHTIRADRVHPDRVGNTLHLYAGLRTKRAQLIFRAKCAAIEKIEIFSIDGESYRKSAGRIFIEGTALSRSEEEAFARRDGFKDFEDMMAFWNGRLPFKGQIIHWNSFRVSRSRG